MDLKVLGGILLVVGTSIGAGMLALPIVTAELGFVGSLILLFACWIVMTGGALALLEVNLWMPQNSNLVSMAKRTIGPHGQIIAWVSNLILFYSLLAAYMGGGSDLFRQLLQHTNLHLSKESAAILFTLVFGSIVWMGIKYVDYTNRGLMLIKFAALFLLMGLLLPLISTDYLAAGNLYQLSSATAITVTITSFGFAPIIPSLRVYFNGDAAKLKKVIVIGSAIPLICYIFWDAVIMGVVPLNGAHGLGNLIHSDNTTSDLVNVLSHATASGSVMLFVKLFTSVCVLTSFLGVSLSLSDFLADGLSLEKKGLSLLAVMAVTFLPPLTIVLLSSDIFIRALEYAGIDCIILVIILPAWMALRGRLKHNDRQGYTLFGGKPLLISLIIISIIIIAWSLISR